MNFLCMCAHNIFEVIFNLFVKQKPNIQNDIHERFDSSEWNQTAAKVFVNGCVECKTQYQIKSIVYSCFEHRRYVYDVSNEKYPSHAHRPII